jgi:Uma2 family endonuclease
LKLGLIEKDQHEYAKASAWFAKGRAVLLPLHEKKLLGGQFRNFVASVDQQLATCKIAESAIASLSFVFAQKPDAISGLLDVRVRALLHRKKTGEATRTAECWSDWADKRDKDRDSQRYDAACALALCAGTSKERGVLLAKAIAALSRARDAGSFKDAKRLAHFEQDADFAAVRDHPAFVSSCSHSSNDLRPCSASSPPLRAIYWRVDGPVSAQGDVRMSVAAPPLMTTEEMLALPDNGTERWLIRGELRERPMTVRNRDHSRVMIRVGQFLANWLDEQAQPRGEIVGGEVGVRLRQTPESTVGIDVAYVDATVAGRRTGDTTLIDGPPVLAVEILSPSDVLEDVNEKIDEYLAAGVRLVWVIDPHDRTVTIYRPGHEPAFVNAAQELSAEPELPGFRAAVARLFS